MARFVIDELDRAWKKAVVLCYNIPSQNLLGRIEKNHEKFS
jgi:hypothetical protein